MKKWSINFDACIRCNTTEHRHTKQGLCIKCYLKEYRENPKNIERIKNSKRKWYTKKDRREEKRIEREEKWFDGKRQEVLERDMFKCTNCKSKDKLTVHHIDGNGRGSLNPNNNIDNLITLCRKCHASIHGKLDKWAKNYDKCIICGTTKVKHNAKGYCANCYSKEFCRKK